MVNAKKKGNANENAWANHLKDNGIKAWKDGGSGGGDREKSDVGNNIGFNFELKAVKKINLKEAWKQSDIASSKNHTIPSVVIHFDGMGEKEWLVVMHSEDWLDMLKRSLEKKDFQIPERENDRELKYALQQLSTVCKRALSFLE